jgi:hypothetical protein
MLWRVVAAFLALGGAAFYCGTPRSLRIAGRMKTTIQFAGILLLASVLGAGAALVLKRGGSADRKFEQTAAAIPVSRAPSESDWLIVPGVRVDRVTAETSEVDLREMYGSDRIVDSSIEAEGDSYPATLVTIDENSMLITWKDAAQRKGPQQVKIQGSRWKTAEGVGFGTTLKELEALNGGPFSVSGCCWDGANLAFGFSPRGKLSRYESEEGRLLLRFATYSDPTGEVAGDGEFTSAHPVLQAANPAVGEISVGF